MKNRFIKSGILFFILAVYFIFQAAPCSAKLLPQDEQYSLAVDKLPSIQGGLESVIKKITYPRIAIQTRIEGKVYVMLYINETGKVDDAVVVKGIGAGCDEEAIRALKNSQFTPGIDKGVPVKTKFSMAINFKIP